MQSCCTCASLLPESNLLNPPSPSSSLPSEKPLPEDRTVLCCGRVICGNCVLKNPRFATYCPFCQISAVPSSLPQGLKDPPSYTSLSSTTAQPPLPPPYTETPDNCYNSTTSSGGGGNINTFRTDNTLTNQEKNETNSDDTLHFLDHQHDTISSLSLRYNVPRGVLRRHNNITSDHLLLARRTILIPGEYYKAGLSLSPRPLEGEEEEAKKTKIRRFMTQFKVSDYDLALSYLDQNAFDFESAVRSYMDDEEWEKSHPLQRKSTQRQQQQQQQKKPGWFG